MAFAGSVRRVARWSGATVLGLIVLALLAFGLVQTGLGKNWLAKLASSLASVSGLTVSIEGVDGFVPADISVRRIVVGDAQGPFVEVEGLRLDWNPLSLFGGALKVERLEADRLALARLPLLEPSDPAAQGGTTLLPFRIGRLAVTEVALAEPVLGHAATLSLIGSADLVSPAQGLALELKVERRDAPGSLAGTLNYVPDTGVLNVDVAAQEPAGGLLARTAGLEGLPEVRATLKGTGPLDAWDGHLSVAAGDVAHVEGAAGVRRVAAGRRVQFALDADIGRLLPATIAPLFEQRTELAGTATVDDALLVAIEKLTVQAAGFGAGITGQIALTGQQTAPTGHQTALNFELVAGDPARFSGLAPGLRWSALRTAGTLRGSFEAPAVATNVTGSDVDGAGYGARSLSLAVATTPDSQGNLAIEASGEAAGLHADDPKVAAALGQSARFALKGTRPVGAAPVLNEASATLTPLAVRFAGRAGTESAAGTLHLERLDLAAFSTFAGRSLAGTAQFDAEVAAGPALSNIRLELKGTTRNISTGISVVDGLFGATTTLGGALRRDEDGSVAVNGFTLAAPGLDLAMDGRIDPRTADLKTRLSLADMAKLDPRLSGPLTGEAAFNGRLEALGVTAKLAVASGKAMGQPLENITLDVVATDLTGLPGGTLRLNGRIAGKPATGTATAASLPDGTRRLDGLDLAIGSVTAKGALALAPAGRIDGRLALVAGDLGDLSVLALTPLGGRLTADLGFDAPDGRQRASVKADAKALHGFGQTLESAKIDLVVLDPLGSPALDGTADLAGLKSGGVIVERAKLTADPASGGTALTVDAVAQGTSIAGRGLLSGAGGERVLRLDTLKLAKGANTLATTAAATLTLSGGTVAIDKLALAARGGGATISGKAGPELDLAIDLRALPLSLAALASGESNASSVSGSVTGQARVSGPAKAPSGTYELAVSRLSTPELANAGVGPLDIKARGKLGGGRIGVEATVAGPSLSGVAVSGSAPIAAGELDLAIKGTVALAIVNPLLATSGARVAGTAVVDASLKGTPAAPRAGGTVRISGGRFDDVVNGVTLERIEGTVTGTDRSVTVTSLSGRTRNGGTVQARGTVGLDPAAGFPGKIDVTLQNAGLVSSELMRLVAEGQLSVEGAFARAPKLAGKLVVKNLDVNIPDRLPGGGVALDVRHVNTRGGPRAPTKPKPAPKAPAGGDGGIALDLAVSAPNNVFVRGMGMEAELGGDLTLRGTSGAPITGGGFEMRRGSFNILGRQLNFSRGKITFNGSTDPDLDFVAETSGNEVTAKILVTGPASQPEVTFTSTPTLPQDEVLARLLFGRSAGSLTAGQAVQVAQTIAQFSGGGPGVIDNLRRSLGVDSLDIGTNSEGTGGQVGIGKRLNDKLYLGVKQGTTPNSSKVTVDIDITKNIRLQGATGADGSSEVGIGAQWDY